jgi:hypothetical protein
VLIAFGAAKLADRLGATGMDSIRKSSAASEFDLSYFTTMPMAQLIVVIVFYSLIVLFCAFVFGVLIFAFIRNTERTVTDVGKELHFRGDDRLVWLLPGVLIVAFIYFIEGLKLKGISLPVIDMIVRSLGLK